MKRILAITLVLALLFQLCIKPGIYAYYVLNVDFISETLCVNKDRPAMCCRGKCYLMTKLDQQNKAEQKLPVNIKETTELIYFSEGSRPSVDVIYGMPVSNQLPPYVASRITAPVFSVFHPPQA